MRNSGRRWTPKGGVGLASRLKVLSLAERHLSPLDPKIEGIENVHFNSFAFGVPVTNLAQANNTSCE